MFNWLRNRTSDLPAVRVDIHSHLLPGLDDGVSNFNQAEEIIRRLINFGYSHLVITPHVMSDAYRNTPNGILSRLEELKQYLAEKEININLAAAAEYYLDESLMRMVESDEPLLTLGNKHLLFETNFISEPFNLRQFIFLATAKGYKPVLAHPERYLYLQNDLDKVQDLIDRGVTMQLNISSLTGYYSKSVQQMANKLVDRGMIHWVGTDCHHLQHAILIGDARRTRHFRKALTLPLLNNTLL